MSAQWDDLRVLLGVWRGGSARGANRHLGMSHATVSRRIDSLETRWGVRIFDRLPTGYELTQDGEELLEVALAVEAEINAARLKLTGRERDLSGIIRVTTFDDLASHFLIEALAKFAERYPEIEFELVLGYESLDLRKREADIAIRGTAKPPDHLIGHKVATLGWSGFATKDYLNSHDLTATGTARWIGFGSRANADSWLKQTHYPYLPVWGLFDNISHQVEAACQGLGLVHLPCYVGDRCKNLVRVPPGLSRRQNDLWLLRHKDTRSTARLRTFSEFLTNEFEHASDWFSGAA